MPELVARSLSGHSAGLLNNNHNNKMTIYKAQ